VCNEPIQYMDANTKQILLRNMQKVLVFGVITITFLMFQSPYQCFLFFFLNKGLHAHCTNGDMPWVMILWKLRFSCSLYFIPSSYTYIIWLIFFGFNFSAMDYENGCTISNKILPVFASSIAPLHGLHHFLAHECPAMTWWYYYESSFLKYTRVPLAIHW